MRGPDFTTGLVAVGATLVFVGVLLAVILPLQRHVMRRRRGLLEDAARRWGWTYAWRAPWLDRRWLGQSFNPVGAPRIYHLLTGTFHGHDAAACEYHAHRTRLAVTVVATPAVIPAIEMLPAGLVAAFARPFLGPPVATGDPQIDSRWRIRCAEPGLVQEILSPGMVAFLRTGPRVPVRFVAGDVISWDERPLDEHAVYPRLALLVEAARLVPPHVWQHYGYDPDAGAGGVPELKG